MVRPSLFLLPLLGSACRPAESCPSEVEDTGIQIGSIDDVCRCQEASISLGTGHNSFEALNDGDGVEMTYGPQGGWHIWGSIRATNTRNVIKINYKVRDIESDIFVVDVTNQVALAKDGECSGIYTGMYGFLDVLELTQGELDTPPELLCMNELELSMTVADSGGRLLTERLVAVARPDEIDEEHCIE